MMVLQVGIPGERKKLQPADVPQSASGMDTVHETDPDSAGVTDLTTAKGNGSI